MNGETSRERLINDLKTLVSDAEELLRARKLPRRDKKSSRV
jgi:hypothetical protein